MQSKSRFRNKEKPRDPQTIIQPVKEKAKAFVISVDNCRDDSIKTIEKDSKSGLTETRVVRWEVVQVKATIAEYMEETRAQYGNINMKLQEMERMEQSLWEMARARNELNSKLLEMLLEQHKSK